MFEYIKKLLSGQISERINHEKYSRDCKRLEEKSDSELTSLLITAKIKYTGQRAKLPLVTLAFFMNIGCFLYLVNVYSRLTATLKLEEVKKVYEGVNSNDFLSMFLNVYLALFFSFIFIEVLFLRVRLTCLKDAHRELLTIQEYKKERNKDEN